MITYYLYGRRDGVGYISKNPVYSEKDEESFFSKMTDYRSAGGEAAKAASEKEPPRKYFLYHFDSARNGRALVWGTSRQAPPSAFSDPNRNSDFSQQFLLNGAEREQALADPAAFLECRNFYTGLQDAYAEVSDSNGKKDWKFELSDTAALSKSENPKYEISELREAFGLEEKELQKLLYAALGFYRYDRIYIILPENTSAATDMALALMGRIYQILPESVREKSGFVTYICNVAGDNADPMVAGINLAFAARTATNIAELKQMKAVCFGRGGPTAEVTIPQSLMELVKWMAEAFETGIVSEPLEIFYDSWTRYLSRDARKQIVDVEFEALYQLRKNYMALADYVEKNDGAFPLGWKEIWDNIDRLRQIIAKRSFMWDKQLTLELLEYEKNVILSYPGDGAECYGRLFQEYEKTAELSDAIEQFFLNRIKTAEDLKKYIQVLQDCMPLRKSVSEHLKEMAADFLEKGTIDESLYLLIMGSYREASRTKAAPLRQRCGKLWKSLNDVGKQEEGILTGDETVKSVSACLKGMFHGPYTAAEVTEALTFSGDCVNKLALPKLYGELLRKLSKEYLESHEPEIGDAGITKWPFVDARHPILMKIQLRQEGVEDFNVLEKEFRSRTSISEEETLNYLRKNMDLPKANALMNVREGEFLRKRLVTILNRLNERTEGEEDHVKKERLFDEVNEALICWFPSCANLILDNIMRQPQGGILGIRDLYGRIVHSRGKADMPKEIPGEMKKAILKFAAEYKIGSDDKKAVKMCQDFLPRELHMNEIECRRASGK